VPSELARPCPEGIMTVMTKPAVHRQSRTIDGVSIRFAESELRGDHAHGGYAAVEPRSS
jgi:hypothetical protein